MKMSLQTTEKTSIDGARVALNGCLSTLG